MLKIQSSEKFILFMWDLLSTNTNNVWTKDTCLCFCIYDLIGLKGLAQDLCIVIGKYGVPNYKMFDLPINSTLKMNFQNIEAICLGEFGKGGGAWKAGMVWTFGGI